MSTAHQFFVPPRLLISLVNVTGHHGWVPPLLTNHSGPGPVSANRSGGGTRPRSRGRPPPVRWPQSSNTLSWHNTPALEEATHLNTP